MDYKLMSMKEKLVVNKNSPIEECNEILEVTRDELLNKITDENPFSSNH